MNGDLAGICGVPVHRVDIWHSSAVRPVTFCRTPLPIFAPAPSLPSARLPHVRGCAVATDGAMHNKRFSLTDLLLAYLYGVAQRQNEMELQEFLRE